MGASFLPLMMFTLLWGGVGIVLPFLVPKGATQGLPDSSGFIDVESQPPSDNSLLSFHPKYFDFNESPVGVPRLGVVRVDNRLKNENLKLISISGNTVHFHSSFFADKVIGPESNTTFEIVFLSRVEGLVESNLYIHTSKGLFKYYVKGFGLPNPYRLKPLVGVRIPVNGTYEPLITMHNTHDTRIQVVEMHSSGADFHLQLPDDVEQNAAGSAWAIEPFETKPVMKGSFHGKADGNHTGFIKIRVNSTSASSEYLLLPVEVQVSSEPGMYSPQDSLDFGLLVQTDKPKTISLFIINAERQPVNVQSVTVKGVQNPAVRIEFRPVVIEPDNSVSTVVALVTFVPSQASDPKYSHGMIQIVSECGKSVTVPFRATVMQGELEYNASSLGFFVKSDHIPPRNFSVRNKFSATVAIYHVEVSHPDLVKLNSFNQTHVIPPGEQKAIFSMKIQKKAEICDAKNKIEVTVKSNITEIKLPLMCYDGKLQMHTFENGEIDCGRIEMYSAHTEYFSLENKNPVEIRLKSWGSNSSWGHVELVGMQKGVKEDLEKIRDFDSLKKSLFLQPGHMAVFSIEIRRPTAEGTFYGEAYVTTDHNQTLRVPFRFAVSKGSVYADTFVFDKVFPGKISCEKLYLGSSYNRTLLLNAIRSRPPKLLWFSPSENPEIPPMRRSYVGKVHFDPRKFCDADCYAGFMMESPIGKMWRKAARLGWEGGEIDWDIYSTLQKRYELVGDTTVSNISVWVDTNEVGGYKVLTQVNYIWPRVTPARPIVFPLTALGNETIVEIPISNPSSFPLLVQAVLGHQYGPQWSRFLSGFSALGTSNLPGSNYSIGEQSFKFRGVLSSSSQQNSSVEVSDIQAERFHEMMSAVESGDLGEYPGLVFVVPPGFKYFIRTVFQPQIKDMANSVILLRNNLTGIEAISVKGRAGTGQLTVGSGPPGSALHFQLTEKLLHACQTELTNKYVSPQLTVRRSFIARNIGEIPLDIRAVEIYPPETTLFGLPWQLPFGIGGGYAGGPTYSVGEYCEGYGFRILNCHSFTLQPNHTHSIDIAFSPDFTMSKVVRTLRLVDSTGGEFNYTLVAMIPSKMLSICTSVISRPSWEYLLKIFLVIGVAVAIIAAALMAYVEAGSVVSSTVVATVRVVPTSEAACKDKENTSKLDLKAVYDKVENRFKRNKDSLKTIPSSNLTTANNNSTSNAMGNGISPVSTNKSSQQMANGTSILANNNNSALRNRRTKKGGIDPSNASTVNSSVNSAALSSSKLVDKSNQKSSSPQAEDMNHMSNSSGFSKKNKENSPARGDGGGTTPNTTALNKKKKANGAATSGVSPAQNAQGNSAGSASGKQKKRRNSGSGSMPNVCLVTGKGLSKAEQEETSSTTTESSNSDDFYIPPPSNSQTEKQKQKGNSSKCMTSSQDNISGSGQQSNKNKAGKDILTKKESGKHEQLTVTDGGPCGIQKAQVNADASAKKNNGKRKDQSGFRVDSPPTGKVIDGKISPSGRHLHHDMAMWDSPQTGSVDGLSEMAAQTESFVMHRPNSNNKKGSTEQLLGAGASGQDGRHRNSQSPPFSQVLQMSGNNYQMQQHQQMQLHGMGGGGNARHRRPTAGVIGQSRYGGGGLISPTASYYIPQLPSGAHQHQPGRQHTPPSRTLSNPGSGGMPMGNNWGTEILPDNGCDIWSRKNSLEAGAGQGSGLSQTFSAVAGSSSTSNEMPPYSSGSVMQQPTYSSIFDGFPTSTSPGLSNRSSDDGGYFSLGNGGGGQMVSSTVPNPAFVGNPTRRCGSHEGWPTSFQNMDIFNTFHLPDFASAAACEAKMQNMAAAQNAAYGGRPAQVPASVSGTSHNYLQRMRSEPTNRDENRGFTSSQKHWNDMNYYDVDNRLMTRSSNSPSGVIGEPPKSKSGEMPSWPATSTSGISNAGSHENISREQGLFSDWSTLGSSSAQGGRRSVGNVSEIWEPAALRSGHDGSKWPAAFENSADSAAVGSGGPRGGNRLSESGLGNLSFPTPVSRNSDVPQNHHREVEAGLGFNPFTSNIWNQNSSADTNWSSPSSSSYYNRE